jgi:hypothetical protein
MNFLVEEPLILLFTYLEESKFQKKNLKKKLYAQHGVQMVKLWLLAQLQERYLLELELLMKK